MMLPASTAGAMASSRKIPREASDASGSDEDDESSSSESEAS